MIMQETWVMIKHLQQQGVPIRAIARQLGIDRNTVRRALRREGLPKYTRTSRRASKLDPFKPYLERRLLECPGLTAVRLCQEIQAQGYAGRCSILRDFLRPLRQEHRRLGQLTVRFETAPGEQGQVDWGHFGTILHQGQRCSLYGFVMVLGYSRALFVHFTITQRLETFLGCHLRAFEAFGGYPRELLYDNVKTVVLARPDLQADAAGQTPRWHPTFLDFAGYYGFTPRLCRPYRARTKGKVERMIRYVRESFFVGRQFVDLADLNRQAALWCATVANARVHATTGEVPALRLAREPLLPLTGRPPYDTRVILPRRVSSACLVAYAGNHYSVPYLYGGRQVQLRVDAEQAQLEIWAEDTCLAIHPLLPGHGRQSLHPDHLDGLWNLTLSGKGQRPLPAPSPPPPREEATGLLHLPGLSAMPEVEVRSLTVYAAFAEEVSA
jgi:transposase